MAQPPSAAMPDQDQVVPGPPLTRDVWMACAHPSARRLPAEGARVYYYPRGHAEQCVPALPADAPLPVDRILCTIEKIDYLTDFIFEDPYAVIHLHPIVEPEEEQDAAPNLADHPGPNNLRCFAKEISLGDIRGALTPTQDMMSLLLPAMGEGQAVQMTDVQGIQWRFAIKGTRLVLDDWRAFYNAKEVKHQDVLVFMSRPEPQEQLLIGLRRRHLGDGNVRAASHAAKLVPQSDVLRAVETGSFAPDMAPAPFTVTYYPRQAPDHFVVACDEVDAALKIKVVGTEVRMLEPEGLELRRANRPDLFYGTVVDVGDAETDSAWRNLTVKWHQAASSSSQICPPPTRVNMWQVIRKTDAAGVKIGVKRRKLQE